MATATYRRERAGETEREVHLLRWVFGGVVVVYLVLTGVLLVGARSAMEAGRSAAVAGRAAIAEPDTAAASAAFQQAVAHFTTARDRLGSPLLVPWSALPVVGQNLRGLALLAAAGAEMSAAGGVGVEALTLVPGGLGALAPTDGVIPLDALGRVEEPLAVAAAHVAAAQRSVDAVAESWLVGPVTDAHVELSRQLDNIAPAVRSASVLTETLPAFLGRDQPRRYFFGAGNPAELRGAGGFIGAWTVLTVEEGRFTFGEFLSISELDSFPPQEVEPPSPSYAARFDRYGGAGFGQNINMTGDFPSAATAISRLYERSEGESVDGTIVATPAALAALLGVTGPVEVDGLGTVGQDNVVEVIANQAYAEFNEGGQRKSFLGEVASQVFGTFLAEGAVADPVAAGRALAGAAAAGDLLFHSAHAKEQEAFEELGIAGALPVETGDMFGVFGNNAAPHKADFYVDREIRYEVVPWPDGSVRSTASVRFVNETPTSGFPREVIGPGEGGLEVGENRTIVSAYLAQSAQLLATRRDGRVVSTMAEVELGHPVHTTTVDLPTGEETTIEYAIRLPGAWEPNRDVTTYRLSFRDQATIRPTQLTFSFLVPDGMAVLSTSHQMNDIDGWLTWRGESSATEVFEVELRRPPLQRIKDGFRSVWDRPL